MRNSACKAAFIIIGDTLGLKADETSYY